MGNKKQTSMLGTNYTLGNHAAIHEDIWLKTPKQDVCKECPYKPKEEKILRWPDGTIKGKGRYSDYW